MDCLRLGEVEPVFGQTGRVVLDITARTAHDGALKWTRAPSTPRAARSILATFPSTCALPSVRALEFEARASAPRSAEEAEQCEEQTAGHRGRVLRRPPHPRAATRGALRRGWRRGERPRAPPAPADAERRPPRPSTVRTSRGTYGAGHDARTTARNTPVGRSGWPRTLPRTLPRLGGAAASTTGARRSWPPMQAARSPCTARWPKRRRSSALDGIALDIKTLRSTAYRYAARARAAQHKRGVRSADAPHVTGKRVVVSLDGGRVRVRRKKRGPQDEEGAQPHSIPTGRNRSSSSCTQLSDAGQAAPLERDPTHPLAQPHAGLLKRARVDEVITALRELCRRAHRRQDPHAPQLLPEEPASFRLHHNASGLGLPRGSGAVEMAAHPSRHQSRASRCASIYWLPESVDAILLLRSFYKSGRWNCLQRMAMTLVGVSASTGKSGMRPTRSSTGSSVDITANWRGTPLTTYETIVDRIGNVRTATGLRVRAELDCSGNIPTSATTSCDALDCWSAMSFTEEWKLQTVTPIKSEDFISITGRLGHRSPPDFFQLTVRPPERHPRASAVCSALALLGSFRAMEFLDGLGEGASLKAGGATVRIFTSFAAVASAFGTWTHALASYSVRMCRSTSRRERMSGVARSSLQKSCRSSTVISPAAAGGADGSVRSSIVLRPRCSFRQRSGHAVTRASRISLRVRKVQPCLPAHNVLLATRHCPNSPRGVDGAVTERERRRSRIGGGRAAETAAT